MVKQRRREFFLSRTFKNIEKYQNIKKYKKKIFREYKKLYIECNTNENKVNDNKN